MGNFLTALKPFLHEFCPQSLYDDGIAPAAKIQLLSLLHEYDSVLLNDAVQLEQVLATLLVSLLQAKLLLCCVSLLSCYRCNRSEIDQTAHNP